MSVTTSLLYGGNDGDGQWLVRMEWCLAGWSMCLPLLIFPCTIKSRSFLLAPAHPGGPGKRAVEWLWCGGGGVSVDVSLLYVAGSECESVFTV